MNEYYYYHEAITKLQFMIWGISYTATSGICRLQKHPMLPFGLGQNSFVV